MATQSPTPPVSGPAEPVPVAVLARTSTLLLQDPAASLRRQITSSHEWLPPGFYVAGYCWDVESGGLDIEDRGHGSYGQFTDQGIPRDGGLADLLSEAKSPNPRFGAVVVEDIERASRDFYNSVKLERELSDQGIPLFATDEPADISGVNPTTLLIRRVKQGFAEYFRLQLKEKTWKGLREHSDAGWNIGKVPYGYAAERITHPNPSKAAQGLSKTRLIRDPDQAPIVAQMYTWRVDSKLAVNSIVAKLNADPAAYPPADPAAGWTRGGVAAMLRNPKYTGHQVFGRRHHGRPVPPDQWHWSPARTHPAIVDRATWDAAQQVGADHATSWDETVPHPTARRSYVLRSRVRCKICQRRMVGITRTHPERGPAGAYAYYICTHDRANPRHVAAAPDHPRTVTAPQDLVLTALRAGLELYTLTPGRADRLRQTAARRSSRAASACRRRRRRTGSAAQADQHRPRQPHPRPRHAVHRPRRFGSPGHAGPHPCSLHRAASRTRNHRRQAQDPHQAGPGGYRRGPGGRAADAARPGARAARAHPGRAIRGPGHPGPVERPHAASHVLRHHHRHHTRHHQLSAHPHQRRPRPSHRARRAGRRHQR